MKRSWLPILMVISACGGSNSARRAASEDAEPEKPWVRAATTGAALQAGTYTAEPMRFVAQSGVFTLEVEMAGKPMQAFTIQPEQVAMRLGDVATLDHPVGHVKFDALSLSGQDEGIAEAITDRVLRNLGAPVQLIFDVHSIGDMQGRLVGEGGTAKGKVLGTLQIDARQEHLTLEVLFERRANNVLAAEVTPFTLDLQPYALHTHLDALAKAIGVRSVAPQVRISGSLELVEFISDGPLPTFVRTPITVNTVDEIRARLDEEVDDFEAQKAALRRQGMSERDVNGMTREAFEAQRALAEKLGLHKNRSAIRR